MDTQELVTDILVAGGGVSGLSAAIAAARAGCRVVLCQDRPVVGGNASSEIRMHIVGADGVLAERNVAMETEGREGGIIEEIRLEACVANPQRSPSMFDLVLFEKCKAEPRLTLMLNTAVISVEKVGTRIVSAIAERQSTQHRWRIRAEVYIDCTGDGRMAFEASAGFSMGREERARYGESLAGDTADRLTLGSTLLFMAKKHEQPMPYRAPAWARKFTEEDLRLRPHAKPGFEYGLEYGYWWLEWGGQKDAIRDNELVRDELLSILLGVWDHIKNGGEHGAENWALEWFGMVPGKRESRRFHGLAVLSESDILESRSWPDRIAYGGWPIDTHPPAGVDAPEEPPCTQRFVSHLYDIPLRACVSRDIPNLMFAGRNISASHIAFASTRVMATCSVVGQGVGTAAALAVRRRAEPGSIAETPELFDQLQQHLLLNDCFLIGVGNSDQRDLARKGEISASSFVPGYGPEQVASGYTRCVHGAQGAPPGRSLRASHRWMSEGLPAWLEFRWEEPQTVSTIVLIFDSGLHRLLTFTLAKGVHDKMRWGQPPVELIRDYRLDVMVKGKWETLVDERGNYQRRRCHTFEPATVCSRLRIVVTATNGEPNARLIELRAYSRNPHLI